MLVVDPDTGKPFRLDDLDPDYRSDLAEHLSRFTCQHVRTEVRTARTADGRPQHRYQCLCCGELRGPAIKQPKDGSSPPVVDLSLQQSFQSSKVAHRAALIDKHIRSQRAKKSEFWRRYVEYLQSSEWREKRRLVLERSAGICEGCRKTEPSEVHHLTYRDVFDEFLFQLVALCRECHQRYHAMEFPGEIFPQSSKFEDLNDDDYYESPCCACRYHSEQGDEDWCGLFDISAASALSDEGPCGPKKAALEPLK